MKDPLLLLQCHATLEVDVPGVIDQKNAYTASERSSEDLVDREHVHTHETLVLEVTAQIEQPLRVGARDEHLGALTSKPDGLLPQPSGLASPSVVLSHGAGHQPDER